jgi:hypothetical protein
VTEFTNDQQTTKIEKKKNKQVIDMGANLSGTRAEL